MAQLANVEITDTFDTWRIKTNQLIVQANQAFETSIASFQYSNNALNNVVIIAANTTANIVGNSTYVISKINEAVIGNTFNAVPEILYSNTVILTRIYNSANTLATTFFSTNSLGQSWSTANYAYSHSNSAFEKANTGGTVSFAAFDQANTGRTHANLSFAQANTTRLHANFAYTQANTARDGSNTAIAGLIQANTARDVANVAYDTIAPYIGVPLFSNSISNFYYTGTLTIGGSKIFSNGMIWML